MMEFNKYRTMDTLKLVGIIAEVYMENNEGELIDPIMCKDADWLTEKSINIKAEDFDFEKFVLNSLNKHFIEELKPEEISVCGNYLSFWKRENEEGYEDENGKYYVSYSVLIKLNGQYVEEEDMMELFPHFEY